VAPTKATRTAFSAGGGKIFAMGEAAWSPHRPVDHVHRHLDDRPHLHVARRLRLHELRVPERERRFPVRAIELVEALEEGACFHGLSRIEIRLDEVVADHDAVRFRHVARHAELEELYQEAALAQVARDGHQHFGGNVGAHHSQRLAIEAHRALDVAGIQRVAREVHARAPCVGQRGHALQRVGRRRRAAALARDRLEPAHAVVVVGIGLDRAPQRALDHVLLVTLRVDLREVVEHRAFRAVPRQIAFEQRLRLVDAPLAQADERERGRRARALGFQLEQPLGGEGDILEEVVVQRLEDRAVERLGVVPVGLERRGKNLVAPVLARDLELASVLVVDLDRIACRLGRECAHALSPTRSPSSPCGRNTSTRMSTMKA
jgi:hypothetical protein